jgi:hypothetical protein
MTRTGWTVTAALALLVASAALGVFRRWLLGPEIEGAHASDAWRVTIRAEGRLPPGQSSFAQTLPRDFPRQHVFGERFAGKELVHSVSRKKGALRRQVAWRRSSPGMASEQPFRVSYSFRVLLGGAAETPARRRRPDDPSQPPAPGEHLGPARGIESDHAAVRALARDATAVRWWAPVPRPEGARWWTPRRRGDLSVAHALFRRVAALPAVEANVEPDRQAFHTPAGALATLRARAGDSAGKSRLLVATLRDRGIPARLVTGLVLSPDEPHPLLHTWAEAWVDGRWLPMCPTFGHFGDESFPDNYLVLALGDVPLFRPRGVLERVLITVQPPAPVPVPAGPQPPPALRRFAREFSLQALRPGEQQVARFLLLLPLAALIVAFFRTVIGVPTFGTFSAALLGLAFLSLKALPWALTIFVVVVLVGWLMRHRLENFHLLQVPRATALLTLIIGLLLVLLVVANRYGIVVSSYVALFPLIILTNLVERFWTVEAEDGAGASFKRLLGTLAVTVTISVCLAPEAVGGWMFRYPETLGAVLAGALLLGRYTGYRLSELFRFRDLVREAEAAALAAAAGKEAPPTVLPAEAVTPTANGDGRAGALPEAPAPEKPTA